VIAGLQEVDPIFSDPVDRLHPKAEIGVELFVENRDSLFFAPNSELFAQLIERPESTLSELSPA
jgi:hypothetical protein